MPDLKTIESDTKGGGLVKTIDGNILVGPDAYEHPYREDYSTNYKNIDRIMKKHLPLNPMLLPGDVITYCSGIRAATYEEDFIIEKSEYVKNLVYAAGIQSPGLASAPAIAEEIERITCAMLSKLMKLKPKDNYNPKRKGIPQLHKMTEDEKSLQARSSLSRPLIRTSAVAMFVAKGILFTSQCLKSRNVFESFSTFASLK
jgi:glycerol-3-phosphate dehydrogenase